MRRENPFSVRLINITSNTMSTTSNTATIKPTVDNTITRMVLPVSDPDLLLSVTESLPVVIVVEESVLVGGDTVVVETTTIMQY